MLNKKHTLLELKTKALVDSLYIGNYKTSKKGKGIEFTDFREYDFSDNVKNIDFTKSELTGKTLVRLYEEERELSVYFIIDLKQSSFETFLNNKSKYDLILEIFYLIGLSAIKSGDKVGSLINYKNNKLFSGKKGKQYFINIVNHLNNKYEESKVKKGFFEKFKNIFIKNEFKNSNSLKYFNSLKIKNSLVLYFTDEININLKDLKILSSKNDLIFCNIFNSFENNLEGNGVIGIENLGINIDLDNKSKIEEYKKMREQEIMKLKKNIVRFGGNYISIDENKDIYKEFYKLFKK